jgi:hypothetical protein
MPWPGQTLSLAAKVEALEGNPVVGYKPSQRQPAPTGDNHQ